jgi:hypothetical protein
MNEQEALEILKEICETNVGDIESMHYYADNLLLSLLEEKYPTLVKQFEALPKWYA